MNSAVTFVKEIGIFAVLVMAAMVISQVFSLIFFICVAASVNSKTLKEVIFRYRCMFREVKRMCLEDGMELYFVISPLDFIKKQLNGNSGLPKTIMLSASWIAKISSEDLRWKLAFFHTVGHEVGHKADEPKALWGSTPKARFTNWVRECRADFYGMKFVNKHCEINGKNELLEAIGMKIANNTGSGDKGAKIDNTHPNWAFRYNLLEKYSEFGKEAIEAIAKEAEFTDRAYITQMIDRAKLC